MTFWVTKSLLVKKCKSLTTSPLPYASEFKNEPSTNSRISYDPVSEDMDGEYKFFLSSQTICRLCESWADVSLFDKVDNFDVAAAVRYVAGITVKQDDWYPKFICSKCLRDLNAAFIFKRKCQLTDLKYRQRAKADFELSPTSIVRHDFTLLLHKMSRGIKIFKSRNNSNTETLPHSEPPTPQPASPSPPSPPPLTPRPVSPPLSVHSLEHLAQSLESPPSPPPLVRKPGLEKHIEKHMRMKKRMKKERHRRERANKKKLICIKCDAEFVDENKFKEHREQSACKRTQCPHCEKTVLNLRIHTRRMHPRGPVFQCQHCDKAYPIMSELSRHMLVHTNQYDFQCTLCPYRGKRKEYLKLHMRSHGSERYLCSECPATFINQSNFNKHRRVHENKQFQCMKCKKSFRYAKQLQVHDEAQHQKIRHTCTMCGQIFKYRTKLLKHELKVHKREKRKLNPSLTTTAQLETNHESNPSVQAELQSVHTPIETYLHFKKTTPTDAHFYSRNYEQP